MGWFTVDMYDSWDSRGCSYDMYTIFCRKTHMLDDIRGKARKGTMVFMKFNKFICLLSI